MKFEATTSQTTESEYPLSAFDNDIPQKDAARVTPVRTTAPPGTGSIIKPKIVTTKIAKKRHAPGWIETGCGIRKTMRANTKARNAVLSNETRVECSRSPGTRVFLPRQLTFKPTVLREWYYLI
jgi:hypothetical protein